MNNNNYIKGLANTDLELAKNKVNEIINDVQGILQELHYIKNAISLKQTSDILAEEARLYDDKFVTVIDTIDAVAGISVPEQVIDAYIKKIIEKEIAAAARFGKTLTVDKYKAEYKKDGSTIITVNFSVNENK